MGQRGVSPDPTPLKILKGERPSRINTAEPVPDDRVTPKAPQSLSPYARVVWRRLAQDLHAKGLLTFWDRDAFSIYCELVTAFRDASGEQKTREMRELAATIRQYAREFGLTPSARSAFIVEQSEQRGKAAGELLS